MGGLTLLTLLLVGCHGGKPTREAGPNVLLVTVDTLRADHLGCYGYDRPTSPTIDRLASEGTRFDRAYAQRGSTWPSLASILTSRYPVTHGIRTNGQRLDPSSTTLAQALEARGWHCGAVLTNTYEQTWRGFQEVVSVPSEPQDAIATQEALRWLQSWPEEPFFLWVHYVAPHDPYRPPQEFRRFGDPNYTGTMTGEVEATTPAMLLPDPPSDADIAHVVSLYDGEVAWTDALIQPVLDALVQRGQLERTLVVVSSDHGEELYDHRRYFFHNASVYEPVLRIPLVLRQPGAIPTDLDIDDVVQSIDLAPTILDLLGVPPPATFQGRSLLPLLRGDDLPEQPAFAELQDRVLVVRTRRHRYISNPESYQPSLVPHVALQISRTEPWAHRNRLLLAPEELYDLKKDPGETWNLAVRPTEEATRLQQVLATFQKDHAWTLGHAVEAQARTLEPEVKQKLEALGYAQSSGNTHALLFDGVDDVVRIQGLTGLDGEGYTLEAWIRTKPGVQSRPDILARRNPRGGADSFTFRIRADKGGVLELGLGSAGREWGTMGQHPIETDRWTHVALTYERAGNILRFYVDGVLDGERRAPIEAARGDLPVWIGGDPLHGPRGRPFSGWIDEVRLWDRVRPPASLASDMKRPLQGNEPGLVFYADMEQGEGQSVGQGTQGTLGLEPTADASDPAWSTEVPFP